jgi:hypothetical protein
MILALESLPNLLPETLLENPGVGASFKACLRKRNLLGEANIVTADFKNQTRLPAAQ